MTYATSAGVAVYLQRALTAAESTAAPAILSAVDDYVTERTGRLYGPAVVVGEQHEIFGQYIFLDRRPVASVQGITIRSPMVGAGAAPSLFGVNYELLDPALGKISIGAQLDFARDTSVVSWGGYILIADYTVVAAVPPSVVQAATALAAHWLQQPDFELYQSVRSGDVSISFAQRFGVPVQVDQLLSGKRRLVYA